MRPRGFYAVFDHGKVTTIAHGFQRARALSPHRAYARFRTREDAEIFSAWWNYEHPHWTEDRSHK